MEKKEVNSNKLELEDKPSKYPINIFFIIGMEFCERFCYYGFKAVLLLYFLTELKLQEKEATDYYHAFVAITYITSIFGAVLADAYLGKFRTIWILSLVHAAGNVLLSISAVPHLSFAKIGALISLILTALGTGGIKPCVSAFGGNQFDQKEEKRIQVFFSMFYFSINLGSLIGIFVTPILRQNVECYGRNCFSLAFGLPAVLMVISFIVFILGKFICGYRMEPPQGAVLIKVIKCVFRALRNKITQRHIKHDHWLNYAEDKYDKTLIEDTKHALKVLLVFSTLPIYSALYDQQGSKWTIQGARMDGYLFGWIVLPDQMGNINSFLILLFIPLFEGVIYPFF